MAFKDSFHEVIPGYRVNGDFMVFAIKSVKRGGLCDGCKLLEIGNFGFGHRTLIQVPDEYTEAPSGYIGVPDTDAIYDALVLAGMSIVTEGALVNPSRVGLLQYDDEKMTAEAAGLGGHFTFNRANVPAFEYAGNDTWNVPDGEFIAFRDLALQRLSTAIEVVGRFSNAFVRLDGSNDYIEFDAKGDANANLLDWSKDWTLGLTLTEFEVASDSKYITLFSSGDNAILLRRGGTNHGLYLTGNDGTTKAGINAWVAPNPGGKLLFTNDATSGFLKYYIGNVDGTYIERTANVATATQGNNNPGSNFCIGKRVSNTASDSLMFHGGVNNVIAADEAFAGPMVPAYFQVSETYDQSSFYGDLTSWIKAGEDAFPAVTDTLGAMTGGELINGSEDDFVEIPES